MDFRTACPLAVVVISVEIAPIDFGNAIGWVKGIAEHAIAGWSTIANGNPQASPVNSVLLCAQGAGLVDRGPYSPARLLASVTWRVVKASRVSVT